MTSLKSIKKKIKLKVINKTNYLISITYKINLFTLQLVFFKYLIIYLNYQTFNA